jgi:flagellar motility protein MotE (MotC chaperone)
MENKKVASLLSEMEPYLAAEILGNMRQAQAAEILSKMPNDKVKALTEKYLIKRFTASSNHQPGPPEK